MTCSALRGFPVIAVPYITALTGAGSNTLQSIPTVSAVFGRVESGTTLLLSYGREGQTWQLIDGSDATDPENGVVRPLDFDGSTNARIWVQL